MSCRCRYASEIEGVVSIGSAALALEDDGTEASFFDALDRARPEDMERAAAIVRSLPALVRWLSKSLEENAEAPGATVAVQVAGVVSECCRTSRRTAASRCSRC